MTIAWPLFYSELHFIVPSSSIFTLFKSDRLRTLSSIWPSAASHCHRLSPHAACCIVKSFNHFLIISKLINPFFFSDPFSKLLCHLLPPHFSSPIIFLNPVHLFTSFSHFLLVHPASSS